MSAMIGQVLAFRGEDDYASNDETLIELTAVEGNTVEIAADVGKIRVYLKFRLHDLVRLAMTEKP